jgi:branched-chain amino acid transport system ATP-binding protein
MTATTGIVGEGAAVGSAGRRLSERLDTLLGGPPKNANRRRVQAPILELRHVDAGYGPFRALFDVSFKLQPGTSTALLGSNGAGKTSVARVCSGLIAPTEGSLLLDGDVVTGFSSFELTRLGVVHVPEGRSVFATLSVEENLVLAFAQLLGKKNVSGALDVAFEMFPILSQRRKQVAGTLSGGQQRMLALARAFPAPPRLLIADELSLGLAPLVVDEVFESLARLRDAGSALLVVEQQVERATALSEHTILLQKGRVAYDGPTAEVGDAIEQVLPTAPGAGGTKS